MFIGETMEATALTSYGALAEAKILKRILELEFEQLEEALKDE